MRRWDRIVCLCMAASEREKCGLQKKHSSFTPISRAYGVDPDLIKGIGLFLMNLCSV